MPASRNEGGVIVTGPAPDSCDKATINNRREGFRRLDHAGLRDRDVKGTYHHRMMLKNQTSSEAKLKVTTAVPYIIVVLMLMSVAYAQEVYFHGVSDEVTDSNCAMHTNSANLVCNDAPFSECPTGKVAAVNAALDTPFVDQRDYRELISKIKSCPSASVALLADNATRDTGQVTAKWGTDNEPSIVEQYNKAVAAHKTFIIPGGNYLVWNAAGPDNLHGKDWWMKSHSKVVVEKGATLNWVGPSGCYGADPKCWEAPIRMAYFNQVDDVDFQLDGDIIGGNVGPNAGPGSPYLNQSAVFYGDVPPGSTHIRIHGSGTIENTYGFDVHFFGSNVVFEGITIKNSAKGTNINADHSIQRNLHLFRSFGIETAANDVLIEGVDFDASGGISLGGAAGFCYGDRVIGNSFRNTVWTNINVSDCPYGAVIDSNTLWVGPGNYNSGFQSHDGVFSTFGNLVVSNNTIICDGGFAGFYNSGSTNMGGDYINNRMLTAPGGKPCTYGVLEETTGKPNKYAFGRLEGSLHDFLVNKPGATPYVRDVEMANGSQYANSNNGSFDPLSTFITRRDKSEAHK